jgi:DNA adenine methylase
VTHSSSETRFPNERSVGASAESPCVAQPLLKWAGGKRWFAPTIAPIAHRYLDQTDGYFVEPFLGSGAVALWLGREKMVLSDVMEPLIEFYECIRDNPGEVAWGLSALGIEGVDKETYLKVRDMRPEKPIQRAARFLYLARLGFNGLVRHNRKGENNVPYGDAVYRKSIIGRSARDAMESLFPNREKIEKVSRVFRGAQVHLGHSDFVEPIEFAGEGDFVYVDPPYAGVYNGYAKDGFTIDDQERLAACLVNAYDRGATIVAHNSLTEEIRYYYGEWCDIIEVKEKRSIAANGSKRERTPCGVMVSNPDIAEAVRGVLHASK